MGIRNVRVDAPTYNPDRVQQVMAGVARAARIEKILEASFGQPVLVEPQGLTLVVFVGNRSCTFEFADGDMLRESQLPEAYRNKEKESFKDVLFWGPVNEKLFQLFQPFMLDDVEEVVKRELRVIYA